MVKQKTIFICTNCGFNSARWQGKCPGCEQWNTFEERFNIAGSPASGKPGENEKPIKLSGLGKEIIVRFSSGLGEVDTVLGGGLVPGSLVLLGGDPGIGKSTLALQIAMHASQNRKNVLYVSGEESAQQIKLRADRISAETDLAVMTETNLETVLNTLAAETPELAIVDSIQTLYSQNVNGVVGGVSQISYATNALMRLAKHQHTVVVIIGHVTKEGMLAGPKTLEHMVDVVLYLEGERFASLRVLRGNKNRFGGTGEVGVFEMSGSGMREVKNPSALFLEHRQEAVAGSCTTAVMEGNKVLLLEVQALTTKTNFGYPRRAASGFEINRLQLILAILQKNLRADLSNQDVYINVTGGFSLDERAADLPVALAVLSSLSGKALPLGTVAFGELGLLGEVRGVVQTEKRIREAEKLGFNQVFVGGKMTAGITGKSEKISIQNIRSLADVGRWVK